MKQLIDCWIALNNRFGGIVELKIDVDDEGFCGYFYIKELKLDE